MSFVAAVVSEAVLVVALLHQYTLVEAAARVLAWLQVFSLSSATGDLVDEKKESKKGRGIQVRLIALRVLHPQGRERN